MNAPQGDTPQSLTGLHVVDAEGAKVGIVQQVYRDDATNDPEWITVRTGLFGMKETFVPLAGARRTGDELQVPYTKATIKEAPRIDADGHLDPSEEERLYRHYGLKQPGSGGGDPGPAGGITEGAGSAAGAGGAAASARPAAAATPDRSTPGTAGARGRATGDPVPHRTRATAGHGAPGGDRTRDATRPMAVSRGRAEGDERADRETASGTELPKEEREFDDGRGKGKGKGKGEGSGPEERR
ncbi:PRC-barrel domain-containing protein [Streptomyces sp. GS7]|uniref:PRC-barrel domain-containing protein n=1 Tax=Streptomyces sp. GS7 TaxID=2692234 RepID=UPI0013191B49|nr:PRC-barrel domain-containing protein [Streptomyces sp. GS7]QHC25317.1 PRC-barrel domain containing protein [Streptomyces sp. GS7]